MFIILFTLLQYVLVEKKEEGNLSVFLGSLST